MHDQNDVVYSRLSERIGELVLNRPAVHNAISREMWLLIPRHLQKLQDEGALTVVIKGEGQSFAAGADINEFKELTSLPAAQLNWDAIASALDFIYSFELPTLAAIDGPCLGGGCLLASACDLRYASERASFSVPIARLGIVLDDLSLGRLAALVGVSRAKELIYRARRLSASEAKTWGLVNEVFAVEEFQEKLAIVLSEIIANSALSIRESKASFSRFLALASNSHNQELIAKSYLLPDSQERIQRALKKE